LNEKVKSLDWIRPFFTNKITDLAINRFDNKPDKLNISIKNSTGTKANE